MKRLVYIVLIAMAITSCDDFLDSRSYTSKDSGSFPKTEEDATQMLTGVYAMLNTSTNDPMSTYFMTAELAADYRFGAGGVDDVNAQARSHLLYDSPDRFDDFWTCHYKAIAGVNAVLSALENMDDGEVKNQKLGEAKFLRAYFYFNLVQLLGDVPLMKTVPQSIEEAKKSPPQASQEEIFKLIGADLWEAYSAMPAKKWDFYPSGTATKWAAAGLLARVYLFYTGFYQKTSLPIEGGQVTKEQVAAALQNCIDNSGHGLVDDFRSLWPYTNSATKKDYPYAANLPTWVKDGENKEHIFVTKFTNLGKWYPPGFTGYSNQFSVYFGIRSGGVRDYKKTFPFGWGYGIGSVNTNLWERWKADEPNDLRRVATIYDTFEETSGYEFGVENQMEETGIWQKKIIAVTAYGKGGNPNELFNSFATHGDYYGPGEDEDSQQLGHATDLVFLRFADILLMHSEITGTANGINTVRARVNLPPVAYSLEALKKERLYELAFEGVRWGDIRRWHDAETELGKIYGVRIYNMGNQTTMKPQGAGVVARYKATKGFFMIPQRQIDLAGGALKQNAGWGTDALYTQWIDN